MRTVDKIKLLNFRRFPSLEIVLDPELSILIGDNESGKSTILLALDLLFAGSRKRVEGIGLDRLLNADSVAEFLASDRQQADLPTLAVEAYFTDQNDPVFNGKNNSDKRVCDGLRFECIPNDSLSVQIQAILDDKEPNFPFEYYDIRFFYFSGTSYTAYNRPLRHLLLDSAQINNAYATREYVKDIYAANVIGTERNKHKNEYRRLKEGFSKTVLSDLNTRLDKHAFALKTSQGTALESDLTLEEGGIALEDKGKGTQSFIKTEFALRRASPSAGLDALLLEEPENHLSHTNMKQLIARIQATSERQVLIATHSNMISSRLSLQKCILLNSSSIDYASLGSLTGETAAFFMKAPDNNILEFILAERVILVEGDAEFMLVEALFTAESGESLESARVHVISVGGTSFKRYLELASMLNIRTAVVRDNDGNYENKCVAAYQGLVNKHIKVFSDQDDTRYTFEVCLYRDNTETCDELFKASRRKLSVQEYMLSNKAEVAFQLLRKKVDTLKAPQYIADAIAWISK